MNEEERKEVYAKISPPEEESTTPLYASDEPGGSSGDAADQALFPLIEYFDLERSTPKEKEWLSYILEYAKGKGAKTKGDLYKIVRSEETKLGAPPLGERRIPRLVRYLKTNAEISELMNIREGLKSPW